MDGSHAPTIHRASAPAPTMVAASDPRPDRRMTPVRQAMLDIFGQDGRPLRAYDLIPRLEAACGRRFQPQTIYRTLDFLLKEGLVLRIESWNAYIARPAAGPDHAALFLLCGRCGDARVVDSATLPGILDALAVVNGFRGERRIVELQGVCGLCRAPEPSAAPSF